jgi:hypothetical protein
LDVSETLCPSSTHTENNQRALSPVSAVAIKILPQIAQDTGSTGHPSHELNE